MESINDVYGCNPCKKSLLGVASEAEKRPTNQDGTKGLAEVN